MWAIKDEIGEDDGECRRIPSPEEMLRVFSDEHTFAVLSILQNGPSSVKDISQFTGMSLIGCYRRVNNLIDMGLVRSCGKRKGSRSKKETLFEPSFERISLEYNSTLGLRMTSSDGPDVYQKVRETPSLLSP